MDHYLIATDKRELEKCPAQEKFIIIFLGTWAPGHPDFTWTPKAKKNLLDSATTASNNNNKTLGLKRTQSLAWPTKKENFTDDESFDSDRSDDSSEEEYTDEELLADACDVVCQLLEQSSIAHIITQLHPSTESTPSRLPKATLDSLISQLTMVSASLRSFLNSSE